MFDKQLLQLFKALVAIFSQLLQLYFLTDYEVAAIFRFLFLVSLDCAQDYVRLAHILTDVSVLVG